MAFEELSSPTSYNLHDLPLTLADRHHSGPSRGTSFALIKGVTSHHAVSNIMRWMTRDPDARYKLAMNMYKDTDPPLTIEVGREVVTSKRL